MTRKKPLRARLGAALVFAAVSSPAFAAGVAPVDQEAQDLDQAIQALKQEVMDLDSRGQGIEQNLLYPAVSRVTVYVGVAVKTLLLKTVSVSIDDGNTVTYQLNDEEARALQDGKVGGLLTLLRANALPGNHRLKADFSASYFESKPETAPMRGHYEAFFIKGQEPSELELTIEQNGFRADPALKLHDWKAAR